MKNERILDWADLDGVVTWEEMQAILTDDSLHKAHEAVAIQAPAFE